jgi:hypothetical protein
LPPVALVHGQDGATNSVPQKGAQKGVIRNFSTPYGKKEE